MLAIPKVMKRIPRKREGMSEAHLKMIRQLPCVVTGRRPVEAHHLLRGPGIVRGMSIKAQDRWAIPVHVEIHREIHKLGNDEAYLDKHGINGTALAQDLWNVSGDFTAMSRIVERYHRISRQYGYTNN